jgi:hypothetical protein
MALRHASCEEQRLCGVRLNYMTMRFIFLAVAIGVAVVGSVSADENVREVQEKLRDRGFYSGTIDGAYSSELCGVDPLPDSQRAANHRAA